MRSLLMLGALLCAVFVVDDALARPKNPYRGHQIQRGAPPRPSDNGYFSNYLTGPGGSKIPIESYPGSATVITRKMMDDLQARSLCDALRYAPGVFVSGC